MSDDRYTLFPDPEQQAVERLDTAPKRSLKLNRTSGALAAKMVVTLFTTKVGAHSAAVSRYGLAPSWIPFFGSKLTMLFRSIQNPIPGLRQIESSG
jgi:hypothetical protein